MANLKEIRNRIDSVNSTKQITSAMKLVAASKLRKAQNAIVAMRPYSLRFEEIMRDVTSTLGEGDVSPYSEQRPIKNVLIVILASNRGLCGAYNSNTIKEALARIESHYGALNASGNLAIITVGRRVSEYFQKRKYNVVGTYDEYSENPQFKDVSQLATQFMADFISKKYDAIELVYNQFVNAATQRLQTERLLPIQKEEHVESETTADYIFQPDQASILQEMIPKTLKIQLFKAFLDSAASEQGSRMTAMHQATDNASDMLKELKLHYNKARQATITNEIIEIVSGAEALNG